MEIEFKTKRLELCYRKWAEARKSFGDEVGRKYIERVNIIKAADGVEDLCRIAALRCHLLSGDRAGQCAMKLTGQMRLIFTVKEGRAQVARICEVSKHYD